MTDNFYPKNAFVICVLLLVAFNLDHVESLSRHRYKMFKEIQRDDLPPAQWFDQQLDHFKQSTKTTWQQVV
jgi:hypothetical protein